jgi:hypothetical protein
LLGNALRRQGPSALRLGLHIPGESGTTSQLPHTHFRTKNENVPDETDPSRADFLQTGGDLARKPHSAGVLASLAQVPKGRAHRLHTAFHTAVAGTHWASQLKDATGNHRTQRRGMRQPQWPPGTHPPTHHQHGCEMRTTILLLQMGNLQLRDKGPPKNAVEWGTQEMVPTWGWACHLQRQPKAPKPLAPSLPQQLSHPIGGWVLTLTSCPASPGQTA